MFRRLDDFYAAWQYLIEGTQKIFSALTDDNLSQSIAEGHRNLGGMAWHIVVTIPEMLELVGLPMPDFDTKALPPKSAAEIQETYRRVTDFWKSAVEENWNDADLEKTDNLYGEVWPRGLTLKVMMDHEIHHRGQMTVLLRQAGAKMPGVYGPAKEEWAGMGAQPPAY
ncbi:MAG: DinB family protein [Calditrichia bacterium]